MSGEEDKLIAEEQNQEVDSKTSQTFEQKNQSDADLTFIAKDHYWSFVFGFWCNPSSNSEKYEIEQQRMLNYMHQDFDKVKTKELSCCEKFGAFLKFNWIALLIIAVFVAMIITFLVPSTSKAVILYMSQYRKFIYKKEKNDMGLVGFNVFLWNVLATFLFPMKSYQDLIIADFMKSAWASLAICTFSTIVAASLGYWLVRLVMLRCFHKHYSKSFKFRVLNSMVKRSPWIASIVVWMLIIPVPLKIYFYSLMPITYYQFIIPAIPLNLIFDFLFNIVGFFFQKGENWELIHTGSEMNIYNMFHVMIGSIMLTLSTVVLIAVTMYWLNQCDHEKRILSGQYEKVYGMMFKNRTIVNENNTKLKKSIENIEETE